MSIHRFANQRLRAMLMSTGRLPPYLERNPRLEYIQTIIRATPPWISTRDFKPLVERRAWLTRLHGEPYVLDHIVPLTHPYVCGLNVPYNVAVIPFRCNAAKSNRFAPGQASLFEDHGQLEFPLC